MRLRLLVVSFLLVCSNLLGQEKNMKWTVDLGGSFINFADVAPFNDEFSNVQLPSVFITKYLNNGFSLALHFTNTSINSNSGLFDNKNKLLTLDLNPRYDFNFSEERLVPYVTSGIGLFVRDEVNKTMAANVGAGCTFWVFPKIGLHFLATYRFGFDDDVIVNHSQFSLGVVFGFNKRKPGGRMSSIVFNSGCFD